MVPACMPTIRLLLSLSPNQIPTRLVLLHAYMQNPYPFSSCCCRRIRYSSRIEDDEQNVSSADGIEAEDSEEEEGGGGCGHDHGDKEDAPAELWDMLRPLIGNCRLRLLKFEDKEAQVRTETRSSQGIGGAVGGGGEESVWGRFWE